MQKSLRGKRICNLNVLFFVVVVDDGVLLSTYIFTMYTQRRRCSEIFHSKCFTFCVLWICWQCVANRPKFLNFISFRSLLFDVCARAYFRRCFSVVTFFSTFVQKFKKHFKCRCIPRQHSRQFVSEQIALWTMGFARKRGKSVCLCAEWINLLSNPCAKKA